MVEHDHPRRAAFGFDQGFHLRIVDPPYFSLVVEIGDLGVVADETEAVAVEHEIFRQRPAVVDDDAPRVGCSSAAYILAAGPGRDGEDLAAVIDDVVERRLDGIGGDIEFGSLAPWRAPVVFCGI